MSAEELLKLIQEYGNAEHNQDDGLALYRLSLIKSELPSQAQQEPEKCDTCRKTKEHPMGVYCSNPFHLIPPAPEGDNP